MEAIQSTDVGFMWKSIEQITGEILRQHLQTDPVIQINL
jgi:hypothetical protein